MCTSIVTIHIVFVQYLYDDGVFLMYKLKLCGGVLWVVDFCWLLSNYPDLLTEILIYDKQKGQQYFYNLLAIKEIICIKWLKFVRYTNT